MKMTFNIKKGSGGLCSMVWSLQVGSNASLDPCFDTLSEPVADQTNFNRERSER